MCSWGGSRAGFRAETVGRESRGWDHAKKVNGRKRHIAVDTLGLLLAVLVTPASRQDRVAAVHLLRRAHTASPHPRHLRADGAYTGTFTTTAQEQHGVTVEIVQRPDTAKGFTVLPRRRVVERTPAWITRHRRRARDHERHPAHHAAFVHWAAIRLMSLHLTRRVQQQALSRHVRCGDVQSVTGLRVMFGTHCRYWC